MHGLLDSSLNQEFIALVFPADNQSEAESRRSAVGCKQEMLYAISIQLQQPLNYHPKSRVHVQASRDS